MILEKENNNNMISKNNKLSKNIIYTIILLMVLLFISICMLYSYLEKEKSDNNDLNIINSNQDNTIKEIVEKYGAIYLSSENKYIYINFKVDLYDKNGESNQNYFESLLDDLIKLKEFEKRSFFLKDDQKNILIKAEYDYDANKHIIYYNDIKDFFSIIDGETYVAVDEVEIMDKVNLHVSSDELSSLINKNLFFKGVKNTIGEGVLLENGYTSFNEGKILMKIYDSRVKSIIFTKDYQENVFDNIKVGTELEKIEEKYNGLNGGSAKEGYLLYRTKDLYAFFYEDEIVVYGYSYFENYTFEKWLEEYIFTKDLKTFIERVTNKWINYDICEYDFDIQYAKITYPSRGVEINIKDNNSLGITFYKNYCFTDKTKQLVKEGKVSLNSKDDYLEITEKSRKEKLSGENE